MKGFIAILLFMLSFSVYADRQEVVCNRTGYSSDPENFHLMLIKEEKNTFTVEPGYVQHGKTTYDAIPPDIFDLEGLAITYFDPEERAVMYLYVNELGRKEIGISNVELDTDSFFKDKRVFTECNFADTGERQHGSSKPLHRAETRGGG